MIHLWRKSFKNFSTNFGKQTASFLKDHEKDRFLASKSLLDFKLDCIHLIQNERDSSLSGLTDHLNNVNISDSDMKQIDFY